MTSRDGEYLKKKSKDQTKKTSSGRRGRSRNQENESKEKIEFKTLSGIAVRRLYGPDVMEKVDYLDVLSLPGEFPFTRGIHPTMYRGRLWTMRQYAGFGTAEESNKRYKYLLSQGNTGLSVAFDLPTQIGYDSDHEMARGEVGKVGVAISTINDMSTLFDDIPLGKVSTSMTINSTAMTLLALYVAVAEKQGVHAKDLRGTVQNDILKEYIARGTYIYPPRESMRLAVDLIEYCSNEMPRWNAISVSGYHIREAGSTAIQEVAFTLADAIAYVEAAIKKDMSVDTFAPQLSFFFNAHSDLLEEVAKFRAARMLWARIMRDRFGAKNPRSMMIRFHTQTAGVSLTAQQPYNNVVRVAYQALAAVLGGTQSLHTNSMDEALAIPSEKAVRIALRTQQIIAHESGTINTIDPLAGSYYIEELTKMIAEEAQRYIDRIDEMGGMMAAIEGGWVQREIAESAYRYQVDVERKRRIVVGVNDYVEKEEAPMDVLKLNPEIEKRQRNRVVQFKKRRNEREVSRVLERLGDAARGDENLSHFVLDSVKSKATLGEISDKLREAFGTYKAKQEV